MITKKKVRNTEELPRSRKHIAGLRKNRSATFSQKRKLSNAERDAQVFQLPPTKKGRKELVRVNFIQEIGENALIT